MSPNNLNHFNANGAAIMIDKTVIECIAIAKSKLVVVHDIFEIIETKKLQSFAFTIRLVDSNVGVFAYFEEISEAYSPMCKIIILIRR